MWEEKKKILISLTEKEIEITDDIKKKLWLRSRSVVFAFLLRSWQDEKSNLKNEEKVDFNL